MYTKISNQYTVNSIPCMRATYNGKKTIVTYKINCLY